MFFLNRGFGVVTQWCNPLTLESEQSGGVRLIPRRALPLERHNKGLQTQLVQLYSAMLSAKTAILASPLSLVPWLYKRR